MKVWRSGTNVCSLASSRTSSSEGVSSGSTATAIQHLVRVAQLHAALGHQDGQVVQDVRGLLGQPLVRLLARRAGHLLRLLAHLRPHELAVGEETRGVAVLRRRGAPLRDRPLERGERLAGHGVELPVVEARALAGVAGGSGRLDEREDRVLVAVEAQLLHALDVAGRLPLVPQLLARARPEPHLARRAGALERLVVHVRQREHLAGARVLDYAGQEVHGHDYGRPEIGTLRNSYVAPISSKPRLR